MTTSDPRHGAARHGHHHEPLDDRIRIDPAKPVELLIQNVLGDVVIRATDRDDVRLRSDGSGWAGRHARLQIEVEGNRIQVQTGANWSLDLGEWARGIFARGKAEVSIDAGDDFDAWPQEQRPGRRGAAQGAGTRFDLLIEIPRSVVATRAKVRAAAGDVSIEGIGGDLDVAAASGEIALRRVAGDLSAQSASGDVQIAGATGALRARSASGEVHVSAADLQRVTIQTVSGDIDVRSSRLVAAEPVKIDTVSGDVHLAFGLAPVAGERGALLEFKTVSGDAHVAPPFASVGKRTWQVGPGGEGCLRIGVRSVSGDLQARLALDVAEPAAPPDLPRPTSTAWTTPEERGGHAHREEGPTIVVPPVPGMPPIPPVPPVQPMPPVPPVMPAADLDRVWADADRARAEGLRAVEDAEREAERAERERERAELEAEREVERAEREAELAERAAELAEREAERAARAEERAAREAERAARATTAEDRDRAPRTEDPPPAPIAPAETLPTAQATSTDPGRGAARLAVLTALERGEIDVDEALRRLEPLGGDLADLALADTADER